MSIKKFIVSRVFLINLIVALLLIAAIVILTLQVLKSYTRHGQSNPVPDFYGLSQTEAVQLAGQYNLKAVVMDSVYSDKVSPGEVVEQQPSAGFGVKENRTILLTINSTQKEKVVLPKLTNISFRQAQVLVENCGLLAGEISYKPSEYNDLVLTVTQESREVSQGDVLLKGSTIDFVIGRDPENQQTPLPDLIGLKPAAAKNILTNAMLNFGVVIYDESIVSEEDSLNAMIWRQRPDTKINTTVKLGTSVDLWITVDEEKLNNAREQGEVLDF
jgi:beta-lactam-binding protein with PASTA domain